MIIIEERSTHKMPGETSLFIKFDYNKSIVDTLRSFDMKFYDKDNYEWEFPLTSLQSILDKLTVIDDIELNIIPDSNQPDVKYDIDTSNYPFQPYSYQLEAINYGLNHNN